MPTVDLATLLTRQAGVLTLAQAGAVGLSPDSVRRRVASGAWTRAHPRVYRVAGHPPSDDARVWAASLWAGPRGVLSGAAAAYVHRMLPRAPAVLEVTLPQSSRRNAPPGIALRRRDLPPSDRGDRAGLRVTRAELTALETTLVVPDGPAFLDRALQQHVDLRAVVAAYHRGLGARGWSRLRPLLVAAHDRTASVSERRLLGLLRRAGLTGWVTNLPVGRWKVDVAFPAARVAIELDSWAWHVDPDRYQGDRRKQNALVTAGWTVLRFTWQDVTARPDHVLRVLGQALERSA